MEQFEIIKDLFKTKKIKVTPQRIAVYYAMKALGHASAEEVAQEVIKTHPTVTIPTIYNVLDCLAENQIISRVMTQGNKMLFDINTNIHHHLYSSDGSQVEDFEDPELTELVWNYMKAKKIDNFEINDIKVQFVGTFKK